MGQRQTWVKGFTLAELLISLAILGVIATFTIPKILSSQQASASNAKAKEVAGMLSAAYQQAKYDGIISSATKPSDILPYLNYAQRDTSGALIDHVPTLSSAACNTTYPCARLHNGGVLLFDDGATFGGTSNLHILNIYFDPDGVYSGSAADGPSKAVEFFVYYDGSITTRAKMKPGSTYSVGLISAMPAADPLWFSWQ